MADIDLAAVNQARIKAGLAPIPVPGGDDGPAFRSDGDDDASEGEEASTLETREAAGPDNWAKLQAERQAKKDRELRKEAAKKAREKAQRHQRLAGRTFSDDEEEEMSTEQWLKQQGKRRKKITATEAARAAEEAKANARYTSKDLKGLKVAHQVTEFDMDTDQILTLKDRNVGEETDEDELENADLLAKEKLKERLDLKKKKPVYDPNEADATGEKKFLAQYDEVINGKKRQQFTLDSKGSAVTEPKVGNTIENELNRLLVDLDTVRKDPISDYKKEKKSAEVKFKRRQKDPNTVIRKREADPELHGTPAEASTPATDGADAMQLDSRPANGAAVRSRKRSFDDMDFDDEDLQRKLAAQRRAKNRKGYVKGEFAKLVLSRPEDADAKAEPKQPVEDSAEADLTTQQWLDSMDPEKYHAEERERERLKKIKEEEELERLRDKVMSKSGDAGEDMFASEDEERERRRRASTASTDDEHKKKLATITEDRDISVGLGNALKLLQERRLLDESAPKTDVQEFRAKQQFLAEKHRREALALARAREERERQRQQDGYNHMSNREREEYNQRQNQRRENEAALDMAKFYERNYQPTVNVRYLDEFNREMGAKEAFKELSHQFHGKGSGAGKREKKLKKIEEERRMAERTALDTSKYANTGREDGGGPTEEVPRGKGPGIRMGN